MRAIIKVVSPSAKPNFDFTEADKIRNILQSDITPSISGGQFVTGSSFLILVQDSVGGHQVNWPANIANGPQPSPSPGSATVYAMIYDEYAARYYLTATPIGGQ